MKTYFHVIFQTVIENIFINDFSSPVDLHLNVFAEKIIIPNENN